MARDRARPTHPLILRCERSEPRRSAPASLAIPGGLLRGRAGSGTQDEGLGGAPMSALGTFALLRPWWFLAIPVVALLALRAAWRSAPLGDWARAVDPALMAHLARAGAVLGGRRQANLAAALAAGLIALALTGPAVERTDGRTFRNLDETVIVVDLSRSVTEGGNLLGVRQAAAAVAEAAGTRAVALVVYAGDAYLGDLPHHRPRQPRHHPVRPRRRYGAGPRLPSRARAGAGPPHPGGGRRGGGRRGADQRRRRHRRGRHPRGPAPSPSRAGACRACSSPPTSRSRPDAPKPDRAALDALARAGGGTVADIATPGPVLDAVGAGLAAAPRGGRLRRAGLRGSRALAAAARGPAGPHPVPQERVMRLSPSR